MLMTKAEQVWLWWVQLNMTRSEKKQKNQVTLITNHFNGTVGLSAVNKQGYGDDWAHKLLWLPEIPSATIQICSVIEM